jgi:uncharacterized protein YdaU (DUF1376 family)
VKLTDNMKWWYIRLLSHQWDHGAVPLDGTACLGIVHPHVSVRRKEWEEWAEMMDIFFPAIDEYMGQNKTLEEVREEVVGAAEKRSQHASKAAQAKWAKQRALLEQSLSTTRALPEHMPPDAKGRGKGEGGRGNTPHPTRSVTT